MSRPLRRILFIMFDQLRFDYLGCTGHPHLKTPHIDRLAKMGMQFTNAYVQSPVCGASRMSYYTGRYVSSHGAAWNNYPLKAGEMTMGDHLRKNGMDAWLIGKTHMTVDKEGMDRLGISRDGIIGARLSECGFDVHTRDDGLWAEGPKGYYDQSRSPYNEYLKARGYDGSNPWASHANAGVDEEGDIATGWLMENAFRPANIDEQDSETPWLTSQAIDFIDSTDTPWLCHLSYIKPHWPYIVPEPYHTMYGSDQVVPPVRNENEKIDTHPVYEAFMNGQIGRTFSRQGVRETVIPAYMGLIKQADDQMGRLFAHLEANGQMEDTMIVITSDHGDYLGDHWLGEKDLFHAPSVKVPLIIYDPRPEADATRGTSSDALVEAIDLCATFIETAGGTSPAHIVEGRSLLGFLHNQPPTEWRQYAISEYDYSSTPAIRALNVAPRDARLFMVATKRWKLIHAEGGFRPLLFDLLNDPDELNDLGNDPDHQSVRDEMYQHLFAWTRRMSQRTTVSDEEILARTSKPAGSRGVLVGMWDEADAPDGSLEKYRGRAGTPQNTSTNNNPDK